MKLPNKKTNRTCLACGTWFRSGKMCLACWRSSWVLRWTLLSTTQCHALIQAYGICVLHIYIYIHMYIIYIFSYHWGEVSFYINSPLSCFSSDPGLCAFGQIAPRRNPRSRTPGVKRPTHIHMSRTCSSRASSLGMCTSEDINRLWWVWQFVFVFVVVVAFVLVLVLLLLVKKIINPIEWACLKLGMGASMK